MFSLKKRPIAAVALAASLAAMASLSLSTAAHAATPKTGSACAVSGQVIATAKFTMVCSAASANTPSQPAKLTWGKQLPVSKANLVMADAWVKSIDLKSSTWGPMTGAFGTFVNPSSKPVRIVAAYTSSAEFVQLHEVVTADGKMIMQQKQGGFTVPAKGTKQMKPGADHTMFMNLKGSVNPGDLIYVTYVTSTGARFTQPFLAKVYSGGNETYNPSGTSTM